MSSSTRTADVLDRLTAGISQLTSSTAWQQWLVVQSRFHQYSFGNTLLILSQTEGRATRVAGFHAWRKLGRNVRKGERAIWIFAPMTRRVQSDDTDEKTVVLSGFKVVPVFDIAQTDGEPLPEIATRLQGDDPSGSYSRLRQLAHSLGYGVEEDYLPDEVNGDCNFTKRTIRVEVRNDERQQVKTLAHELGHALLHEGFGGGRDLAELEAESVAYIVCAKLGINSDDYTFGYVAAWSGGGGEAISAIKSAGGRIQQAADTILARLEAGEEASSVEAVAA